MPGHSDAQAAGAPPQQRIDIFLWHVRLAPARAAARALAERGIMRLNGRRVERAHSPVRPGDLLTLPVGRAVRTLRVLSLPHRRGPAPEAQLCYRWVEPDLPEDIAASPPSEGSSDIDARPRGE